MPLLLAATGSPHGIWLVSSNQVGPFVLTSAGPNSPLEILEENVAG